MVGRAGWKVVSNHFPRSQRTISIHFPRSRHNVSCFQVPFETRHDGQFRTIFLAPDPTLSIPIRDARCIMVFSRCKRPFSRPQQTNNGGNHNWTNSHQQHRWMNNNFSFELSSTVAAVQTTDTASDDIIPLPPRRYTFRRRWRWRWRRRRQIRIDLCATCWYGNVDRGILSKPISYPFRFRTLRVSLNKTMSIIRSYFQWQIRFELSSPLIYELPPPSSIDAFVTRPRGHDIVCGTTQCGAGSDNASSTPTKILPSAFWFLWKTTKQTWTGDDTCIKPDVPFLGRIPKRSCFLL